MAFALCTTPVNTQLVIATKRWFHLAFSLALLTAWWLYQPGMRGGFLFDDILHIVANPTLPPPSLTLPYLIDASFSYHSEALGRPVSMLSLAFETHWFGKDPWLLKQTNVLLHLLTAGLCYAFLNLLLRTASDQRVLTWTPIRRHLVATVASTLWLLHPFNLTPALYVIQRMTSLSAFFSLSALILYLMARNQAERGHWVKVGAFTVAILLASALSVLSKESAILLPWYVLSIEIFLRFRTNSPVLKRCITTVLTIGCATLPLWLFAQILLHPDWLTETYTIRPFTAEERVLTQLRVLFFYLGQIISPRINEMALLHHDFEISHGLLTPMSTLLALLGWISLIIGAIHLRHRNPVVLFAILWFLFGHLLESSFISLELVHEHRNYLPSIGPLLALSSIIVALPSGRIARIAAPIAVTVLTLVFALQLSLRVREWSDDVERSRIEAVFHPNSVGSQYEYSRFQYASYVITGKRTYLDAAIDSIERVVARDSSDVMTLFALLSIQLKTGVPPRHINPYQELVRRLSSGPIQLAGRTNLGFLLTVNTTAAEPLTAKQLEAIFDSVQRNPRASRLQKAEWALAHARYLSDSRTGSDKQIQQLILNAFNLNPENRAMQLAYAKVLIQAGDLGAAERILDKLSEHWLSWTKPEVAFWREQVKNAINNDP